MAIARSALLFAWMVSLGGCALDHQGSGEEAATAEPGRPAATADAAGRRAAEGPAHPPTDAPVDAPPECVLSLDWATPSVTIVPGPHEIAVSPNGRLATRGMMRFGGEAFRLEDGRWIGTHQDGLSMDRDWARAAFVAARATFAEGEGALVTMDLEDGSVLHRAPPPTPAAGAERVSTERVELAADGDVMFAVDCHHSTERIESMAHLRVVPVQDPGTARSIPLGVGCRDHGWQSPAALFPGADGTDVIVARLEDAAVARVDLATDEVHVVRPNLGPIAEARNGLDSEGYAPSGPHPTLGAARSTPGDRVAIVTHDGMLRLLDARTLVPVAPPRPVALVSANRHSYVPSVESPVAFDPTGRRLAFVDTDGKVAILRLGDDVVEQRLEAPFEDDGGDDDAFRYAYPSAPMALHLGATQLLVSYEGGTARFACDAPDVEDNGGRLRLSVSAPETAQAGAPVSIRVVVEGARPALRWLERDGRIASVGSLTPEIQWWGSGPGEHTFTVVADDGGRRATEELTITVPE